MQKIENYIGGELVKPASSQYLDSIDPATDEVYSFIPDSDDRDVHLAVEAAGAAFTAWSKTPPAAGNFDLSQHCDIFYR